jgi:hypothetical protein
MTYQRMQQGWDHSASSCNSKVLSRHKCIDALTGLTHKHRGTCDQGCVRATSMAAIQAVFTRRGQQRAPHPPALAAP